MSGMHQIEATRDRPAHLVYVIDTSYSMAEPLEGKRKIDHVHAALRASIIEMIKRSTTGAVLSPRYQIAMIAYSEQADDVFGGFLDITKIAEMGFPEFSASESTDTRAGLIKARDLLARVVPTIGRCPAPLVCHLTDGDFTAGDPEPIAREIMQMALPDGNVLMENIYLGSGLTRTAIPDYRLWPGLQHEGELTDEYARKLFRMSSCLPSSLAETIQADGLNLAAGRRMLLPGSNPDLVQVAFTMATSTARGPQR